MISLLSAIWRYRHFIVSSIRAEFINRFARSRLGAVWMFLHPLAQATVLALVLSSVLASRLPGVQHPAGYALYLLAGTLVWSLFLETVNRCLTVFTQGGELLKKLVFPRICLPVIAAGISGISSAILASVTLTLFVLMGHPPSLFALGLIPILLALTLALAMGIGLILGVLNVFIRDVGQVVPILLQFLYWLTPIVYLPSLLPTSVGQALAWNPLYPLVQASQAVLVFGQSPDWLGLLGSMSVAGLLLALAWVFFRRAAADMVDQL